MGNGLQGGDNAAVFVAEVFVETRAEALVCGTARIQTTAVRKSARIRLTMLFTPVYLREFAKIASYSIIITETNEKWNTFSKKIFRFF